MTIGRALFPLSQVLLIRVANVYVGVFACGMWGECAGAAPLSVVYFIVWYFKISKLDRILLTKIFLLKKVIVI